MSFIMLDSVSSVYDTESNEMTMLEENFGYWKNEVVEMGDVNDNVFEAMNVNDLTELYPYLESDVSSVGI